MYVEIKQARYEYDPNGSDRLLGKSSWGPVYLQAYKAYTFDSKHYALNTELGDEEDFHRVTFRTYHGSWSPWQTLTSHYGTIPV